MAKAPQLKAEELLFKDCQSLFQDDIGLVIDFAVSLVQKISQIVGNTRKYLEINPCTIYVIKTIDGPLLVSRIVVTEEQVRGVSTDAQTQDYRDSYEELGTLLYNVFTQNQLLQKKDINSLETKTISDKSIPKTLALIIEKLRDPCPQSRYQSNRGLLDDLLQCQMDLKKIGKIFYRLPGQTDLPMQLEFGDRLYGRDKEIKELKHLVSEVKRGESRVLFVSGYSGIGKTSLVKQIILSSEKDRILKGKFDQVNVNACLGFTEIIKDFSNEVNSDDARTFWRKKLNKELSPNSQVLVAFEKSLEKIVGKQDDLERLSPTQTQNRFMLVFCRFIEVIAKEKWPLILFLDDLQWSDDISLQLLKQLIHMEIPGLLLIAAFRDNECGEDHGVTKLIRSLEEKETITKIKLERLNQDEVRDQMTSLFSSEKTIESTVKRVHLSGLSESVIQEQLSKMLKLKSNEAQVLSQLVMEKTKGNPFFMRQWLCSMQEKRLIVYNSDHHEWQWQLEALKVENVTDQVASLLIERMDRLSETTCRILLFSACLGTMFTLEDLSVVSGEDQVSICLHLRYAEQKSLIATVMTSEEPNYTFLHDRIQEAAYALIPKGERDRYHLEIGKKLYDTVKNTTEKRKEKLFQIAGHMKQGVTEISDNYLEWGTLFYDAGIKARDNASFTLAKDYFQAGSYLIEKITQEESRALMVTLCKEIAACDYLLGDSDGGDEAIKKGLALSTDLLKRAELNITRIVGYCGLSKNNEVLVVGQEALIELLGEKFRKNSKIRAVIKLLLFKWRFKRNAFEVICSLPNSNDQRSNYAQLIMEHLCYASHQIGNMELGLMFVTESIQMIMKNGVCGRSPFFFSGLACLLLGLGYVHAAVNLDQVARRLSAQYKDKSTSVKLQHISGSFILIWDKPISHVIEDLKQVAKMALEIGDFLYLLPAYANLVNTSVFFGNSLIDIEEAANDYWMYAKKVYATNHDELAGSMFVATRKTMFVKGLKNNKDRLKFVSLMSEKSNDYSAHYLECEILKLYVLYLFEHPLKAIEHIRYINKTYVHLFQIAYDNFRMSPIILYSGLVGARISGDIEQDRQTKKQCLTWLKTARKKFKKWAKIVPYNHEQHYYLIEAEFSRLKKRYKKAARFYDRAIESAKKNDFIMIAGIANECAYRFYHSQQKLEKADHYLQQSIHEFQLFGATAKADLLKKQKAAGANCPTQA